MVLTVTQNGRFLKFNKNLQVWVEVPEAIARQKVCQALQYRRRKGSLQNGVSLGCNEELRGPAQLVSHSAAVLGASFTRHEAFAPLPKPQPFAASAATKVEIDESDTDFISLLRTLSQSSAEGDR